MKKIFLLSLFVLLCACQGTLEDFNVNGSTKTPVNQKSRLTMKDYIIKGRVYGEYHRFCVLAGMFCAGDVFIYNDLMRKAEAIGGNLITDLVVDDEGSSPLWYLLYSNKKYKATAMAVSVTNSVKGAHIDVISD